MKNRSWWMTMNETSSGFFSLTNLALVPKPFLCHGAAAHPDFNTALFITQLFSFHPTGSLSVIYCMITIQITKEYEGPFKPWWNKFIGETFEATPLADKATGKISNFYLTSNGIEKLRNLQGLSGKGNAVVHADCCEVVAVGNIKVKQVSLKELA